MNDSNPNPSRALRTTTAAGLLARRFRVAGALFLGVGALLLGGCDRKSSPASSSNSPGTVLTNPANGNRFVVDPNFSGNANRIKLLSAFWGRLVDVYDVNNTLLFKDFVIGDNIASDLVHFKLDRNAVTETDTLTILHPYGSPEFNVKFAEIERNVQPVRKNGLNVLPSQTLTAIPRNAALVLVFDDLLETSEVTPKNVAVLTGYPPILPYEARVIPDPSHGDLQDTDGDGVPEFYSTRVVIDMTVSQLEAQLSNPPLPVNSLGLPEAQVVDQPNVLIRIPTTPAPSIGQLSVLTNLSGSGMNVDANAPNDPNSVTEDVVRSLRSSSDDLQDPNNGFLIDQIAPRIIGLQGITLTSINPTGGNNFLVSAQFDAAVCAPAPRVGDVIRIGNTALALVTQAGAAPAGGLITDVPVQLQVGSAATFLPGQAQYLMTYDPTVLIPPACFVRFSPTPAQINLPNTGVQPNATIAVRFSEPMDPASVSAFETFTVTRLPYPQGTASLQTGVLGNTITASIQPSLDLKEFVFTPQLPLEHVPVGHFSGPFPNGEEYLLTLVGGANGTVDLSGKPVADALPPVTFRLDPTAATAKSRTFGFKFNALDEDGNGAPELRGQFLFNLSKGTIRPRTVSRFSSVADQTQPVLGIQTPFTAPIQTPLSNLGSKMMTVYRYHDLGMGLVDDSTLNLDVEGISWAPFIGLQVDTFSRFRMALSHSKFLPDEIINAMSLLPLHPLSGLVKTFDQNVLDPINDPLKIVHAKDLGYHVQPVDAFISSTGTLMMPYPLNRGLTKSQMTRYTWRDTGLLAVGGPSGGGAETGINGFALGITPVILYGVNKVPTVGLPLLMEFRCYPDDTAFGLNGFKVNIALNSSARPAFRAFSTGGVLTTGALVKVDPDNEPVAKGGINPATGQPTGFGTEIDPVVYIGQVDFVVRVNRVHSIWLDTFQITGIEYQAPITEPPAALQPLGTQVIVALRGATNVTPGTVPPGGVAPRTNAVTYDPYGDPRAGVVVSGNFAVTFPTGPGGGPDNTWKTNMSLLNTGAQIRFVQTRITMISNPDTLLFPELAAMGFSLKYS